MIRTTWLLLLCLAPAPVVANPEATPTPSRAASYADYPETGRRVLQLHVTGEVETCMGAFIARPCFVAHASDGSRMRFPHGIEGYEFAAGRVEDIVVEEIRYALPPTAPQDDFPSIRYVLD